MYTRAVEKKKGESRRIAKRNRKNLSVQYMIFLMKTGEMLKKNHSSTMVRDTTHC